MSIPLACDMTAIPPEQRAAHHALKEYETVTDFIRAELQLPALTH